MKKFFLGGISALAMLCLFTGCGYHIGFFGHPQIQSIAVAPAVNDTAVYNVASDMRMMACEAIQQDGTYKLSDQKHADCILFLTVRNAAFTELTGDSFKKDNYYKPQEWRVRVDVEYQLVIPGQGTPLLKGHSIGEAQFYGGQDLENSRLRASRQACYDAAQEIVYAIAEGW